MTEDQAEVLIGQNGTMVSDIDNLNQTVNHLSGQLDLMHQTIATQTQYEIWLFVIAALTCSFVAFLAGLLLAKGR